MDGPAEAGTDPGATVMDRDDADALRDEVLDDWLRERLSGPAQPDDLVAALFLHDAGLVGRYASAGGQELLVALQAAARSPAAAPHGLWLLCPADSAAATPHLDKLMVEVTEVSERLVLDGDFLDGLRENAA